MSSPELLPTAELSEFGYCFFPHGKGEDRKKHMPESAEVLEKISILNFIVCPYCDANYRQEPSEPFNEREFCRSCGKGYTIEKTTGLYSCPNNYRTSPRCDMNGEQHEWHVLLYAEYERNDWCSKCGCVENKGKIENWEEIKKETEAKWEKFFNEPDDNEEKPDGN